MTPSELFNKLLKMYPDAYTKDSAVEWAGQFQTSLRYVKPDRLQEAFDATIQNWTYARPPRPGDIWNHIQTPPTGIGNYSSKTPEQWPHRRMANRVLREEFIGRKSLTEGWASGLWQFIATQGLIPSEQEERDIIVTDEKIRGWEKAINRGEKIEIEGVNGIIDFPENAKGALLGICARREKILAKF